MLLLDLFGPYDSAHCNRLKDKHSQDSKHESNPEPY